MPLSQRRAPRLRDRSCLPQAHTGTMLGRWHMIRDSTGHAPLPLSSPGVFLGVPCVFWGQSWEIYMKSFLSLTSVAFLFLCLGCVSTHVHRQTTHTDRCSCVVYLSDERS